MGGPTRECVRRGAANEARVRRAPTKYLLDQKLSKRWGGSRRQRGHITEHLTAVYLPKVLQGSWGKSRSCKKRTGKVVENSRKRRPDT